MKIITQHFGIVEVKPKKIFEHNNIKYAIATSPYKYINSRDITHIQRCFHFETGCSIPVNCSRNQSIKSFIDEAKRTLDIIYNKLGAEKFNNELNSKEKLN